MPQAFADVRSPDACDVMTRDCRDEASFGHRPASVSGTSDLTDPFLGSRAELVDAVTVAGPSARRRFVGRRNAGSMFPSCSTARAMPESLVAAPEREGLNAAGRRCRSRPLPGVFAGMGEDEFLRGVYHLNGLLGESRSVASRDLDAVILLAIDSVLVAHRQHLHWKYSGETGVLVALVLADPKDPTGTVELLRDSGAWRRASGT